MTDTSQFGMYKAPEIPNLIADSPLYGKNVFIITPYNPGFTIYVTLGYGVNVNLQIATWDGVIIEKLNEVHMQALSLNESFIPHASNVGINKYQIFFSDELAITDFVEPQGQFISPGMLTQLFGSAFKTQTVVATGILDSATIISELNQYPELIIKPSAKIAIDGDNTRPLYARISQSMAAHR